MTILFDGVCNFCNASINFVIDRDSKGIFKFAALQSEVGQEILRKFSLKTQDFDSIIAIDGDNVFQKSDAALEIARRMDGLWKLCYVFKVIPSFLRNPIYDLIARNRYKIFGKTEACRIPTPELKARFL
ncbi:thiol-disulfide oxidoreductase DCC [Emticicia oligotrophica DSM 17448]|uniref:Thiol-disulfide oxidoreductase DCC n=1 Tax=Emticicia oligotrophica (strain DSM 17448 / CIP 109782 / MTCC 6937 / GPTSA100-15) TaxID=929562 RepID=A0ABM5MZ63_EMTOG|nr:thiol-disulfide oxidoreductase DCC family protein [Emticicia oligotrophica]AFK02269.1 thiol-disulfide oxidoreductase DCC [Emticicia oligotrophica DSM 17448]